MKLWSQVGLPLTALSSHDPVIMSWSSPDKVGENINSTCGQLCVCAMWRKVCAVEWIAAAYVLCGRKAWDRPVCLSAMQIQAGFTLVDPYSHNVGLGYKHWTSHQREWMLGLSWPQPYLKILYNQGPDDSTLIESATQWEPVQVF